MENNRQKGSRYEKIAAAYLQEHGMKIREMNYRCRLGEIDIIAEDKEYLCFVEVKYRASNKYGYPAEAVNYYKQKKIISVAQYYMKANRIPFNTSLRFDVVAILGDNIDLIKNAFWSV